LRPAQLQQDAALAGAAIATVLPAAGATAADGAQQAVVATGSAVSVSPLKVGTVPSVWKVSHAMPVGSVTQYLFERA
jgi:hypothetical protein